MSASHNVQIAMLAAPLCIRSLIIFNNEFKNSTAAAFSQKGAVSEASEVEDVPEEKRHTDCEKLLLTTLVPRQEWREVTRDS